MCKISLSRGFDKLKPGSHNNRPNSQQSLLKMKGGGGGHILVPVRRPVYCNVVFWTKTKSAVTINLLSFGCLIRGLSYGDFADPGSGTGTLNPLDPQSGINFTGISMFYTGTGYY
jgi:hypothetical protein